MSKGRTNHATFRFEIQGEKSVDVNAGDFVFIPIYSLSSHQSDDLPWTDPCINFLYTDAPADMHFVDETGAEIPFDQALKNYAKTHPK